MLWNVLTATCTLHRPLKKKKRNTWCQTFRFFFLDLSWVGGKMLACSFYLCGSFHLADLTGKITLINLFIKLLISAHFCLLGLAWDIDSVILSTLIRVGQIRNVKTAASLLVSLALGGGNIKCTDDRGCVCGCTFTDDRVCVCMIVHLHMIVCVCVCVIVNLQMIVGVCGCTLWLWYYMLQMWLQCFIIVFAVLANIA